MLEQNAGAGYVLISYTVSLLLWIAGKQHTYVETENVRYVYQPLEGLFVVLITTKASNILEDLETLRLLSKLIPDIAPPADEDSVCRAAFDLIFAFDEVIASGLKENVTIQQVGVVIHIYIYIYI